MLNIGFVFLQEAGVQETADRAIQAGQAAQNTITKLINGFFAQLPLIGVGLVIILVFWGVASLSENSLEARPRAQILT